MIPYGYRKDRRWALNGTPRGFGQVIPKGRARAAARREVAAEAKRAAEDAAQPADVCPCMDGSGIGERACQVPYGVYVDDEEPTLARVRSDLLFRSSM